MLSYKNLIFVFLSKLKQIKTKTFVVDEFVERRKEKFEKLLITAIFIERFFFDDEKVIFFNF